MTNGIVFIIHSAPATAFVGELAEALTPHVALAMPFTSHPSARQAAYGPGATCVVMLDETLAIQPDAILRIAPAATSVICRGQGVGLSPALSAYSVVEAQPTLDATAATLRDAVTNKQAEVAERNASRRRATHAPAMQRVPARNVAKNSMLARSAWGLAATVVVAGIAAPAIGGRAGAASVADADPLGGATETSDVMMIAQPVALEAVTPQRFDPPPLVELLDHIDQNAADVTLSISAPGIEELAAPEPMLASLTGLMAPEPVFASVQQDVEIGIKPNTLMAVVAEVVQPKGGAAPRGSGAADKPQVAGGALKPGA